MAGQPHKKPLSAGTYLLRNAGKTLPLTAVIVLAVMLIAGIVSLMNSIPLSIRTIYAYSELQLGVTPRGDSSRLPEIRERIERQSPVPIEHVMTVRTAGAEVQSIVGKWPFAVLAMTQEDMRFYLDRVKPKRVQGRLPEAGAAEALISEPVARNLGLKMGDTLLGPEVQGRFSRQNVTIVGIAETAYWLMVIPIEYHTLNHFPPIDALMVFARTPSEQRLLDDWAVEAFKGEPAQILAYRNLQEETDDMFRILYKILNVVIGTLVLVITFMMALLMNIYQSQRIQEFGLLQALGYTKRKLLARVIGESVLVVVGGWILGVLAAFGMLNVVRDAIFFDQAFALDTLDRVAYLYTLPVPLAILIAASYTVFLRFRRFDPVGVVERRLV